MPQFFLRQAAEQDLEEIWLYSFKRWGKQQADDYISALLNRLQWLAEHPNAGKLRPDVEPGYCYFPEGRHLIFYQLQAEDIEIIGIVHQSMDYLDHFENEP